MARMPWFRFWVDAHEKGKIAALSDSEFRLLTRVWALARQSERPGWIYVVPGTGYDPQELVTGARCKSAKDPAAMLKRLAALRLIRLHKGGVIEVHDWEEHNPPTPASKLPIARRQQKRKERGRQHVASVSPGDNEATGQDVGRTETEEEEEKEEEQKDRQPGRPIADRLAGPVIDLTAIRRRLGEEFQHEGPLGIGDDVQRVQASFERWLTRVGEDALIAECVRLAKEKGVDPWNLSWFPGWLDTVPTCRLDGIGRSHDRVARVAS